MKSPSERTPRDGDARSIDDADAAFPRRANERGRCELERTFEKSSSDPSRRKTQREHRPWVACTPGKAQIGSALPYKRSAPSWLKITPTEVTEMIVKMAKKGMTPSQIGVMLRDNQGIAQVSTVTNSKIFCASFAGQGLAPSLRRISIA